MGSKDSGHMSDDELRALHQSIEQLNAINRKNQCEDGSPVSDSSRSTKRKRVKATSADVETQTPTKRRKKKINNSDQILDESGIQIDEILEEIASRKNLTVHNVKDLLRSIIANDNVQEMLKCSLEEERKLPFEPKLTRSKTKEWLETQNLSRVSNKKLSDTRILMEEELLEDSSDDEYRPCEDDIENPSDEESFVSSQASDIGSPLPVSSTRCSSTFIDDENFKKPLPIQQSSEDLIGSRTRSKLPLNDTPLEHLELAFIPPDISTDMYDSDCDNEEWRNFLKEFMCPPPRTTSENQDDEEADPEYNVLEEEEEVDDEEMRADRTVQITKKEVRELLSELFEEDFSTSDEETRDGAALRPAQTQSASQDILQAALNGIIPPGDQNATILTKTPAKPTGVVQPLPALNPSAGLSFTVSFPTVDYAPIQVNASSPTPEVGPPSCSETPLMSPESRLILEDQLRKHVQLLTQMHLITTQMTELAPVAEKCRSMLQDLQPFSHQLNVYNLNEAISLVNHWEVVAPKIPPDKLKRIQRTVLDTGSRKIFSNRSSAHPKRYPFNPEMVELMANSCVFIYPELLPKLAVFEIERGPCIPSSHEQQLIAMGLEQFSPFCKLLLGQKKPNMNLVSSMISHFMLPHWTSRQITVRRKKLCMLSAQPNPVKYYMEHNEAPPVHHEVRPLERICKLRDIPAHLLPERWREAMIMNEARWHKKNMEFLQLTPREQMVSTRTVDPSLCLTNLTPVSNEKPKKRKPNQAKKTNRLSRKAIMTGNCSEQTSIIDVATEERPPSCLLDQGIYPRGSPSHTRSPNQKDQKNDKPIREDTGEILKSPSGSTTSGNVSSNDIGNEKEASHHENASEPTNVECSNSSLSSNSSLLVSMNHPAKRYVLIQQENGSSDQIVHVWGPSSGGAHKYPVRTAADQPTTNNENGGNTTSSANNSAKNTNSGLQVTSSSESGPSGAGAGADGGDDGDKPPSSPSGNLAADDATGVEDEEEEDDAMNADSLNTTPLRPQSAPIKNRSPAHRHLRHERNARRILDSWMAEDDSASISNDAYALAYFAKVRKQLEQENPNAFKDFVNTLGHFQSSSSSITELYKKMESILGDYPDLMDEFVLFLSPEAAAQCGLQFQHFLYVRMRDFFAKLKIHFKDSPSQLKRALKALQQIEASPNPSIADIKSAMLPLLRGNNYLTQVFLQFFVDDLPPPSDPGDFEDVNIDQVNSEDEFENVNMCDSSGNLRDSDSKGAKRTGSKGVAKNKSKGKAWKKANRMAEQFNWTRAE